MDITGPSITIGPFHVGPDGRLSPRNPDVPPGLTYSWLGRVIRANLSGARLDLVANAGRVPSSVSDAAHRAACLDTVSALPALLPRDWTLLLASDHVVMLRTTSAIDDPVSVKGLIAALTSFALSASPYLQVLEEAGVT